MTEAVNTPAGLETWIDEVKQRQNPEDAAETIKMTKELLAGLVCEGIPTPVTGVEENGVVSLSWLTKTTFMEIWVDAKEGYEFLWMDTTVIKEDRKPEHTLEFTETKVGPAINAVASWDFEDMYPNRHFS